MAIACFLIRHPFHRKPQRLLTQPQFHPHTSRNGAATEPPLSRILTSDEILGEDEVRRLADDATVGHCVCVEGNKYPCGSQIADSVCEGLAVGAGKLKRLTPPKHRGKR